MAPCPELDPPERPSSDFEARPAERAEREVQAQLFDACFPAPGGGGGSSAQAVLAWRYDRCPHGEPVTWLGWSQGKAVSAYACNPRQIGWGAAAVTIGQTGDVMSHPDARGHGFFTRLDRAAMQRTAELGWPVVFGLPNRQSAPLFLERLGWKGVGRLRPWTFVLCPGPEARRERLRAGRLAAWFTPWAYRRGRQARKALAPRAEFRVVPVERFGPWVEPLVRVVGERYAWMVRRDADWLNWRFFDSPNRRFDALRVLDESDATIAYAVLQKPEPGRALGFLVDLVGRDESASRMALGAALRRFEEWSVQAVRTHAIAGSAWESFLVGHAFQAPKPQDEKWVIAYVHQPDHPLAQAALDPTGWFFTDADRDDELVR